MPPAGYAGDDARAFVVQHRVELQTEIAAGSGPRIYNLAIIANCQDVPALGRRLHRHQDDFFPPESAGAAPAARSPGATDPSSGTSSSSASAIASSATSADAEAADRIVRFMSESRELRCLSLDLSRTRDMSAGRRQILPRRSQVTARGGTW